MFSCEFLENRHIPSPADSVRSFDVSLQECSHRRAASLRDDAINPISDLTTVDRPHQPYQTVALGPDIARRHPALDAPCFEQRAPSAAMGWSSVAWEMKTSFM
jgi:hypothetical protein